MKIRVEFSDDFKLKSFYCEANAEQLKIVNKHIDAMKRELLQREVDVFFAEREEAKRGLKKVG